MTSEEFVKNFYQEKQSTLELYFNEKTKTEVQSLIKSMNLDEKQNQEVMHKVCCLLYISKIYIEEC